MSYYLYGALVVSGALPAASAADEIPVSLAAGLNYAATPITSVIGPILGGGVPWMSCTANEQLTTSDATKTTCATISLATYGGAMVIAWVNGTNNAKTVSCSWTVTASVTNNGGALTIVDVVSEPTDPVSTLAFELDTNGTDVLARVTGVASGGDPALDVNWTVSLMALMSGSQ